MDSWLLFLLFSPVYIPLVISLVIFFNAERGNRAKRTLSLVLLNLSFLFFGLYYFLSGSYDIYARILIPNVMSLLLVYPGIYIYLRQLINPSYPLRKRILHLIPAGFVLLQGIVYYSMLDARGEVEFVTYFRFNPDWNRLVLVFMFFCRIINIILLFAQIFFYGFQTMLLLRKYSAEIQEIFSNTEGINLNSIKVLNFVFFVSSIASIAFYSINPIKVFGNYLALIIPLIIVSIAIWLLGIIGLRQKLLPELVAVEEIQQEVTEEDLEEEPGKQLYARASEYISANKPYLNPELKIDDLMVVLGTNRTHLSNAINRYGNKNFSRFINEYRIEFAREYMAKNNSGCSKEEVATASGFGSVRSFERNFKDCVGESFSQYLAKD